MGIRNRHRLCSYHLRPDLRRPLQPVRALSVIYGLNTANMVRAITICFALWQDFPWKKVPYYIFSQIFGAFMAGMLLMGMYWPEISAFKAATLAQGLPLVSSTGPAFILCTIPGPTQNNLGYLFMIEFFVDSFIVSLHKSKHYNGLWPN